MSGKTIVAPASAPGRGGVSVIRMSGANSREIAENMCGSLADSWKFKKCNIKSLDGTVLDNGLVVFFKSPHSYTGEDVVEFHCCLLYTSPSPRDDELSRMPSSA